MNAAPGGPQRGPQRGAQRGPQGAPTIEPTDHEGRVGLFEIRSISRQD